MIQVLSSCFIDSTLDSSESYVKPNLDALTLLNKRRETPNEGYFR